MTEPSGTTGGMVAGRVAANLGTVERAVSIGLGAALLARVLGRAVLGPALLGLGAAALIWRGANGFCPIKAGLLDDTGRRDGGARAPNRPPARRRRSAAADDDAVQRTSEDSFPASDPPAWTPTNGPGRRH